MGNLHKTSSARGRSRAFRPVCLVALALLLAAGHVHADTTSADYDYSYSGIGNKYRDDGFGGAGFGNGADNYGNAGDRTGDKAAGADRDGRTADGKAKDLTNMGDQIGKDYNKLVPLVNQARQQDARNSSGSSRLGALFASPYNPPKQYKTPFHQLGLDTNGNLYTKGPSTRDWLYSQADQMHQYATKSFDDAAKAAAAAQQLRRLRDTAQARGQRMGVIAQEGSGNARLLGAARGGGLNGFGTGDGDGAGVDGGKTQRVQASDISARSEGSLESGGGRGHGTSGSESGGTYGGGGGGGRAAKAKEGNDPRDVKGAETVISAADMAADKQRAQRAFDALDALFDDTAKKTAKGEYKGGGMGLPAIGSSGSKAADPAGESLALVNAVLEVEAPELERAIAQAPQLAQSTDQGNAFVLEEDSLFHRVHQSLERASANGRLAAGGRARAD